MSWASGFAWPVKFIEISAILLNAASRNVPPHSSPGTLRDDTKNGCVADYKWHDNPMMFIFHVGKVDQQQ